MSWTLIVPVPANFSTPPEDKGTQWLVQAWNAPTYYYKLIDEDTIALSWYLDATQVVGNPSELRLALPKEYETDPAAPLQATTFLYNNDWRVKKPTPKEVGIATVENPAGGQRYVALRRGCPPGDFYSPRWSATEKMLRPSYGWMGGTYLFGQIILAVRPRPAPPVP